MQRGGFFFVFVLNRRFRLNSASDEFSELLKIILFKTIEYVLIR